MHKMSNNKQHQRRLSEGLEQGDLARLISPELHIDEFKSKMGADADIIVLSFKVNGKEPARDLMSFFEKGYEWILDADLSSGELDDGEYLVFVELERSVEAPEYIMQLLSDVMNLTKQKLSEWAFQYRKDGKQLEVSKNNLANIIPLTSDAYTAKFGDGSEEDADADIKAMQESARVPMKRSAPVNSWTDSLRVAAGLK